MSAATHTNRLIGETSPYLLQHAHNPVDWYPWGEEAFAAARRDGKPILLSVGYSSCHWCHVMERESFENPDIAALMNRDFVNVKVDREERPDVDHIYMNAVQMLIGRGGWPMTVFLHPDGRPFYGGTYFPPEPRHGMPSFPQVLQVIAQKYREAPDEVERATDEITHRLRQIESVSGDGTLPADSLLLDAAAALARAYDETYGGIGDAPKFPNTGVLDLWLRAGHAGRDRRYTDMTLHTLRQMARGGLRDQIGGGFHRYSVDRVWLVPHFEKMLYDNAQLVPVYLAAHQLTGDEDFAAVARDTLDYVLREMRHPDGAFYSSQDADSEGVEGRFFVWQRSEVEEIVGPDAADLVCRYWGISEHGNFEGANIPHIAIDLEPLAKLFGRATGEIGATITAAREKLFAARRTRVAPARDDKILTSWNSLMISAFARASEVLGDDRYGGAARQAVAFVERNLRRGDRLLATIKDGDARLNGYLDDYAFYANALVDVFEASQDRQYLAAAAEIASSMLRHFWDPSGGGLYFTSDDHEQLIVRSKPAFDGSIPSGNSVAAHGLLRLYHHTGDSTFLDRAEGILRVFGRAAANQPFGLANLIAAADFHRRGPLEIAVVVDPRSAGSDPLLNRIRATYLPNRVLTVVDPDPDSPRPPLLAGKGLVDEKTTVYVCHRRTCSLPATEWDDVARLIDETTAVV